MNAANFFITQATAQDIEAIMRIEQNAFVNSVVEESTSFMERISAFPQGFLLLKNGNETAGYFCGELWLEAEVPYPAEMFKLGHSAFKSHKKDGTMLYISSMGILSAYRGKGLGGYLFNTSIVHILENVPQITKTILLVNETWLPARAIYQKARFSEIQILANFFEDTKNIEKKRQNGIIMTKKQ